MTLASVSWIDSLRRAARGLWRKAAVARADCTIICGIRKLLLFTSLRAKSTDWPGPLCFPGRVGRVDRCCCCLPIRHVHARKKPHPFKVQAAWRASVHPVAFVLAEPTSVMVARRAAEGKQKVQEKNESVARTCGSPLAVDKTTSPARINSRSGCSSVWPERPVRDRKVGGSSPLTPTIYDDH